MTTDERRARAVCDFLLEGAGPCPKICAGCLRQSLAIRQSDEAAGMVLVPMEPTEAMCSAGAVAIIDSGIPDFPGENTVQTVSARLNEEDAGTVYRAMIAALQSAYEQGRAEERERRDG